MLFVPEVNPIVLVPEPDQSDTDNGIMCKCLDSYQTRTLVSRFPRSQSDRASKRRAGAGLIQGGSTPQHTGPRDPL